MGSRTTAAGAAEPGGSFGIGAASRRLGVAVATLRSWDRRYRIGATGLSPGGHRRYTEDDLARLAHMCRLIDTGVPPAEAAALAVAGDAPAPAPASSSSVPVPEAAAVSPTARAGGGATLPLGRPSPGRAGQGLAKAAMRLDPVAIGGLLDQALAADGVIATWEDLVVPVLFGMGRKWESANAAPGGRGGGGSGHGIRYVEVEHLLTCCVSAALQRAASRTPPHPEPGARLARGVLLACTPDEHHTLALEALAAALGERGVPVRMFGASLPRAALLQAVRRTGPAAVVLWSQTARTCDPESLDALREIPRTAVMPLGPGWRAAGTDPLPPVPRDLRTAVATLAGGP
ncbi:MerR family transcriptional regulator [Yinghuangia soli]|uniref:MerR family transcriptional regulator n=1 Tax=Yinghuangia soli TaxID=2908204 RepID=A0AA41Q9Y0_9ACTN|nr:MerR family transcriptional regulator [Yinghuangia soli]MCF2533936.1 MerR family transcriptional regulator [Yinghuangia soli]